MTASHTLCTLNEWVGLRGCVASNPLAGVGSVRMLRLSEGESPICLRWTRASPLLSPRRVSCSEAGLAMLYEAS